MECTERAQHHAIITTVLVQCQRQHWHMSPSGSRRPTQEMIRDRGGENED